MKTALRRTTRLAATAAVLLCAGPALGALQDHGPADPTLGFPQWYRDLDGTAVGICKSQAPSPNDAAGLAPMCFPIAPAPDGFPGNLGDELFYNNLTVVIGQGTDFSLRYVAALEATYLPLGVPVRGTETVFARIRVLIGTTKAGTYTVTHPYGVEVFPDVPGDGPRSLFYTVDMPLGPELDFDGALGGRLGPWIQWDVLNPGESLTVGSEQFLGDPNYPHTYTGSPFGTNYIRVDGPPGSNLDGAGNDFIVEPLGTVLGQRWTAPIPTRFSIQRAVYSRTAAANSVDVWATSIAGQKLVLTGTDMPSIQLREFPGGNYYAHVEYPSTFVPPASVTLTNLTSNPVNSLTAGLADQLDAVATYASAGGSLSVTASSSDQSIHTLSVLGPYGGIMTSPAAPGGAYTFSGLVPATDEPPRVIDVQSNAGGVFKANVLVTQGNPMNPSGQPTAVNDAAIVAGAGSTPIDVSLNDTYAGTIQVLVLTQPATGTAVAAPSGGIVTYTPNPGASGLDAFTYAIQDSVGISNVATVSFNVPFVAPPPSAGADNFAMLQGTSRTYAVLGNDTAGVGTVINPASVAVTTTPANGTAVANPDGTITYTPRIGFNSAIDTFAYTVSNTSGTSSAPAIVTVVVFGGPESVSLGKVIYTTSKSSWTIVGSTNWFNAALTQTTATCWTGTAPAPTASTLIGTAPVDTTGKFQLVPAGPTPVPANPSSATCKTSNGGIKSGGVTFK